MWLETRSTAERQVFVAFKIAEVCNLACGYCYFFEKDDQSHRSAPAYVSDDLVLASAKFLARGASDMKLPTVTIALHGGEPLMLGKERVANICEVLHREIAPYAECRLGIQTNGVLLDHEWISLLQSFNCSIGISLDGPKALHDSARPDKRGRGTYDRVTAAVRLLQECETRKEIPSFGVLSVIDPNMSARQAYNLFVHTLGVRNVYFRPPSMSWDTADFRVVERVNTFLREIFDVWAEHDDATVHVRPNIEALHSIIHDGGVVNRIAQIVDLAQAISIRSNGDVCPDDSLPPLSSRYRNLGFNVRTHSLSDFCAAPIWAEILDSITSARNDCASCRWFGTCGGGFMANRFSHDSLFEKPSVYCDGYQSFYSAVYGYVTKYLHVDGVDERLLRARRTLTSMQLQTGALT